MKYILVKDDIEIGDPKPWDGAAMSKAVYEATNGQVSVSLPAGDPQGELILGSVSLRPVEGVDAADPGGMAVEAEPDPEAQAAQAAQELKWKRQELLVDLGLALIAIAERAGLELSAEDQSAIDRFKTPE